jgi:exopolyphosphatase/guanosine-5'-triphosphate,3'-diphosphate pyrophosphatase
LASASDRQAVAEQLGRDRLVPFTVIARCSPGHPLVIRNRPIDLEGQPFPTLYWLTCQQAVAEVSRLESQGWIKSLADQAELDPDLRADLARAHRDYAIERGRFHAGANEWGGVAGTSRGVKCLHAHFAHYLAGGNDPIGSWVARRVEVRSLHFEKGARRLAAVDLGTNSIRLLVARFPHEGRDLHDLARDMVITRIGQGVDESRRISSEALHRTVAELERYCRRARALGVERIHLAATSAVRDAVNREELDSAVEHLTGEPMEVLSGEVEAALTFSGATHGLEAPAPFLVVDIGGGSTEFVLGDIEPDEAVSVDIGSVRLTERFMRSDPPKLEELEAIDRAIAEALTDVERRIRPERAATLVAVAGTSTTVQAIALGLGEYDPQRLHRSFLSAQDAERVFRILADMTTAERRALPVMAPGREDVIPAGAAILVAAMRRWGFRQALVSETDILDGIAYRMAE